MHWCRISEPSTVSYVIPGFSRYVKFLPFGRLLVGEFRHKFYTQKEDPGICKSGSPVSTKEFVAECCSDAGLLGIPVYQSCKQTFVSLTWTSEPWFSSGEKILFCFGWSWGVSTTTTTTTWHSGRPKTNDTPPDLPHPVRWVFSTPSTVPILSVGKDGVSPKGESVQKTSPSLVLQVADDLFSEKRDQNLMAFQYQISGFWMILVAFFLPDMWDKKPPLPVDIKFGDFRKTNCVAKNRFTMPVWFKWKV